MARNGVCGDVDGEAVEGLRGWQAPACMVAPERRSENGPADSQIGSILIEQWLKRHHEVLLKVLLLEQRVANGVHCIGTQLNDDTILIGVRHEVVRVGCFSVANVDP